VNKLKLVDGSQFDLPDTEKGAAQVIAHALSHRGQVPTAESPVDWKDFAEKYIIAKDAVSITHLRPLLAVSTQEAIREPLELAPTITGLFNKVQVQGMEVRMVQGAIGAALYAEDIGEAGTYPEGNIQVGGGMQTAAIGKSGLQVSFTEEALRYCTWDIMSMNMRYMRDALVRHKEHKAALLLRELGTELFNNTSPSTSLFGTCTGRGLDATANGSATADDVFRAASHMAEEGFWPDLLIVHPQTAFMWLQDPVLRNLFMAGNGGSWFNMWQGNVGPTDPWSNGSAGIAGPSHGNAITPVGAISGGTPTGIAGREWGMTSAPTVPGYFGWPMRVVASPHIPYDVESGLTDILLASSGNVGLLLQEQEPVTSTWTNERTDVVTAKIVERYAFQVGNQGQSIGIMKNIPARGRNYWDGTLSAHTLGINSEIDQSVAIPGL
jgi:hypothetical protein